MRREVKILGCLGSFACILFSFSLFYFKMSTEMDSIAFSRSHITCLCKTNTDKHLHNKYIQRDSSILLWYCVQLVFVRSQCVRLMTVIHTHTNYIQMYAIRKMIFLCANATLYRVCLCNMCLCVRFNTTINIMPHWICFFLFFSLACFEIRFIGVCVRFV